jgi:hypothetical protein
MGATSTKYKMKDVLDEDLGVAKEQILDMENFTKTFSTVVNKRDQ